VELVDVDRGQPVCILLHVEPTHSNFAEITRMVSIVKISVMQETTSLSSPARMFPVLADTTVAAADMATHATILTQTGNHLFMEAEDTAAKRYKLDQSLKEIKKKFATKKSPAPKPSKLTNQMLRVLVAASYIATGAFVIIYLKQS
jgi:hypothetical protein